MGLTENRVIAYLAICVQKIMTHYEIWGYPIPRQSQVGIRCLKGLASQIPTTVAPLDAQFAAFIRALEESPAARPKSFPHNKSSHKLYLLRLCDLWVTQNLSYPHHSHAFVPIWKSKNPWLPGRCHGNQSGFSLKFREKTTPSTWERSSCSQSRFRHTPNQID